LVNAGLSRPSARQDARRRGGDAEQDDANRKDERFDV
jgi:hypothetical protein